MVGVREEVNTFWATSIWLTKTTWQQLLLPMSLKMVMVRLESNSFMGRKITLARTAWQQLLLPEEL
jgi:hypothetical protein